NPCTPLPVKFISFTTVKDNGNVKISWQTIEEKDNDYYVVERSTDGINFTALTTVKGNKNSSSLISYIQYDDGPYLGTSYYRLKQVDLNGSFSYSSIAAVEFDSPTDWVIYPNPSKDGSFTIASGFAENEVVTVTVTDVTGNRVRYYDNSLYAQEIHVRDLSSGLYIVSIQTVTQLLSKKLVVE
ncbi:MAG TPA: T9SS type A sorting domain-containing protein, partial [Cytophaga sp.]|nr:T9SS type A sorting domain-containing protein [Cytophaga sp.]